MEPEALFGVALPVERGKGKALKRDVFVYFDNTDKLRAPHAARALMGQLGQASPAR